MYHLASSTPHDHDTLLSVWEASVRATHHFLAASDIDFFRALINDNQLFRQVVITTATNEGGEIIAFSGVSGDNLEMLFVHPDHFGNGVGKQLLLHALQTQNISRVDVNEQNIAALAFYRHFGFDVTSRSAKDGTGKPYPVLHLQWRKA